MAHIELGVSVRSGERRLAILRVILGGSIISTALHFTHNYLEIERYPQSDLVSNSTVRLAIVLSWPLLTAAGLVGYRLYTRQLFGRAALGLALSSLLGIATLGHFMDGSPDISPFWYATIFTDGIAGFGLLAFAYYTGIIAARTDVTPT